MVVVVAALLILAMLGRVVLLQTTQAESLREAGYAQRTSETVLKADRGTIFARDGAELAMSVAATTIYADPRLVTDPVGTVTVLAQLIGLSAEKQAQLVAAFEAKSRGFVYVARQLDDELAATVLAMNLPGVDGYREDKRIMPSGEVGRSVVGRTDIDGIGLGGLEKQYDDMLTGVDGERVLEHDREGRSLPGSGTTTREPVPGDDLVLSLDRSLQYQVENHLLARVDELAANGGTVIVMDTATGEIYAIANVRRGADGIAAVTSANLAAVEANEPGSVAKVFSIAAAIDQGVVTPDTVMSVPGFMIFNEDTEFERKITDAYPHEEIPMTVTDILVDSSNIGTIMAAQQLGVLPLGDYLDSFGFGEPTGLDFPGESGGLMKPADQWEGTERVSPSYGYGFSSTSLQLAAAVNAVANDGVYVAPKLVVATIDSAGEIHDAAPSASHTVLKPETAAAMTQMMTKVVCDGTASKAKLPGISVAGKTGTAYRVQDNGTYEGDDGERAYYASFVGFLPAGDPRVTILVSIDQPDAASQDRFGGTAAAPLFATIAQSAIQELAITPTVGDTGCASQG